MPRFKTCGGCGERYEKAPDHEPFRNWCGTECAITIARGRQAKQRERQRQREAAAKKQREKQHRKERRDFNRRDVNWQHEKTQTAFNRMRVLEELLWFQKRGMEPECISCGKTQMDWCCGHFKTVGSSSELRYSRANTALQCNTHCNNNLSGNIEGNKHTRGYRQGIIDRFGEELGRQRIEYLDSFYGMAKWEWQDLEAFRKRINERIRELERDLRGDVVDGVPHGTAVGW